MPLGPEVFANRRRRFMDAIGSGAAAIIVAAPEAVRSNDVEHSYHQHSDLHYLTGFPEPEAVCLLLPGHEDEEYVLFVRPRDPDRETWVGTRAGVEGAREHYGAGAAHPIAELDEKVTEYLADRERVYFALDPNTRWFRPRVIEWLERGQATRPRAGSGPSTLLDTREILHEMRVRKAPEEIHLMRRAAAITVDAHRRVMAEARPGRYEFEMEAVIASVFRSVGATGPAYPSIVASGAGATTLHYTSNDRQMADGELLLVDAGAEFESYCADVTRTIPVGMRFEGRCRDVYEIVLAAQQRAIETVRPDVTLEDVHAAALEVIVEGLLHLGLVTASRDEVLEKELYKPFYMHRTSHWLGLDVHDVGKYKIGAGPRLLEAGMVLTVEPGLYLGDRIEGLEPEWHGIGVRIEDDVLVADGGGEVLTAAAPKSCDDIEALRAEATVS